MNVEIHIAELVLRGVAPADAEAVTSALRNRLEQLALDGVAPTAARDEPGVVHRPRPVPGGNPRDLGTQAATAVWRAAGGQPS